MNLKIFPATINSEGQKVPLIKGWNELATNDPVQIKLWQELFRDRIKLWGVPCGSVNGIVALDIDVKKVNGWNSLQGLGYQIPETIRQDTPSGGSHFFFRAKPGVHYPNSVNSRLGLDTRGDRGWVGYYGLLNPGTPLAEAPDWLGTLSPKSEPAPLIVSPITLAPEIAEAQFKEAINNIINAPAGESNDTLNRESHRVGQLLGASTISRAFAEQELFRAAKLRNKPDHEAFATIKSGLDGGAKHPLGSPFPIEPLHPFLIPPPPELPSRWTPPYFTRADLLNTSKLRKPQLFRDWSTEDISITTADGGTGKTTLKLYEAICLALGDRFLGFECLQRGKTLFITGEDTDKKLGAMLGAIMRQMGLFDGSPENEQRIETILSSIVIKKDADLCLISQDKQGFLHPNQSAMTKLLEAVEDIKPKMIVFDPIASFWGSESKLNDMNKAVTRFMSDLVDRSQACVEMINHMGKSSSASKDMTQFAGRGGSGLPSNSRVSRVLRALPNEEYQELTGAELFGDQTAMLVNVNKFSDGSPLVNKSFIVIRDGYLFSRVNLSPQKARELEKEMKDDEVIFNWIKAERKKGKYPTKKAVVGYFMSSGDKMSQARVDRAITNAIYQGFRGEAVQEIPNIDLTSRESLLTVIDLSTGKEI